MNSASRWFMGVLAVAVTTAVSVGAFNVVVDPWGLNYWLQKEGFNRAKPDVVRYSRLAKAHAVVRLKPTGAVFGTSTAEQGLDMAHPVWHDYPRAQNLGFAGATIEEIQLFVQQAHAVSKLRRIVIGLDFFSFNANLGVNPQLQEALGAMRNPLIGWRPYFSWKMFAASLDTLLQQPSLTPYYLMNGQSDPAFMQQWVSASGGHRRVFLFSERGLVKGLLPQPSLRFELQKGSAPSSIDHLRELAEFAQREGIELRLFFSPTHARLLETIRILKLWPHFEFWKQQAVLAVEPIAQRANGRISIWDFADYSAITAEPLPAERDATTRMRWFWDAQHYKPELGNLVLDRLFGSGTAGAFSPPGYGVQVNAANINKHLLGLRGRQQAYEAAHQDELAEIRANIEKALRTQGIRLN